ncbi:MAG: YCF48-related protein [Flavobacteriales bacterium]
MQRSLLLFGAFFLYAIGLQGQSCLGDTIFYEDFANGFSGNNALGLSWDTTGTYQSWRECSSPCGTNGPYTDVGPLQSTTAGNGYVNLDVQADAGYIYATGQAPPGYQGGPPPEQHMTVGPMDLSGLTDPVLRFQTAFYFCCASGHDLQVRVSTNGGSSWTDTIPVLPYISVNQMTENPARVLIPLGSAIASNPSNVTLRFTWPPTVSGSQVAGVYNWYIDDVFVGEANRNDLAVGNSLYKVDSATLMADHGDPLEYTMLPKCDMGCLTFGTRICNIGRNSLNNVQLRSTIYDANTGNQVYQENSSSFSLDSMHCIGGGMQGFPGPIADTADTVWTAPCFSTLDTGAYLAEYRAIAGTTDCDTSNNFGQVEAFRVTDSTYAVDEYEAIDTVTGVFVSPQSGGSYEPVTAYNAFEFTWFDNTDTIKSISVYIDDTTQAGAGPVQVGISNNVARNTVHGRSAAYYIQASDLGSWVTLPIVEDGDGNALPNGLPVADLNDSLKTAFFHYQGGSERVGIGASGTNPGVGSWVEGNFGGGGSALYRASDIPMLRVNTNGAAQSSISATACSSYTVPSGDTTYTSSGTYQDTLAGYIGCDSVFTINLTIDSSSASSLIAANDTLYASPSGTSYDWMDCDSVNGGPISTASGSVFYPDSNGLYSVSVTDTTANCSYSSSICRTSLPNSDWNAYSLSNDSLMSSVHFVDSANGWITGFGGTILRTSDGGSSWTLQLDTNFALLDIHFEDTLNGWVVGANGEILHTTTGGSSWNAQSSGVTDTLTDCHFLTTSQGWVAGHNGLLLKTTDSGSTWTPQASGTSADLHGLYFQDSSLAWVSGKNGTVLKTTDAGNTWNQQSTGVSEDLYDITFASDTAGWTVGTNGTVLHTDDGGGSWANQASGTYEPLYSINMLSPNDGYIVGAYGTVLFTQSARSTWNPVFDARLHTMRGVEVIDGQTVHVVGAKGSYLRKTSGTTSLRNRSDLSDRITLRPNPAKDRAWLELEGGSYRDKHYTLYSSMGRRVIERTGFQKEETSLDLTGLERGIYFLRVEWEGKGGQYRRAVKKLVLE